MRTTGFILSAMLLFCIACKEQPLSYTLSLQKAKPLTGELWKKGGGGSLYTDICATDRYYAFSLYENDTAIHVFDKDNAGQCVGFMMHEKDGKGNYAIDFIKSNTRYPSEKNDIWIVENKRTIKQLRQGDNSLVPVTTEPLPPFNTRSTSYSFTKSEMYGVPDLGNLTKNFYFYHPDSGYYWVEMHGLDKKNWKQYEKLYKRNPYAFLSNLRIDETQNAAACAYLFFNQIHFFDLKGKITRIVTIGDKNIFPVNKWPEPVIDYENSAKCTIDMCHTGQYVYCLYNGSKDFEANSRIIVFKWDGTHVRTYETDRQLKKITIDRSGNKLIALAANEQGGRDVVRYAVK